MQTYFLAAGASKRPNIMDKIEKIIIYASFSNVIIVDTETRKKNIIVRDYKNEITYLHAFDKLIILCDVLGNIEIYELYCDLDYKLNALCFTNKKLYAVALTNNKDCFVGMGIDEIYLFGDNCILKFVQTQNLLSTLCRITAESNDDLYVFGHNNGSVEIYNSLLECKISKKIHNNSITSIKHKSVHGISYILSSSLDFTVKICKVIMNDGVLELYEVDTLYGHIDRVLGCNWMHNNNIISCSSDNSVIIWQEHTEKWTLKNKLGGLFEKAQTFYNCLEVNNDIFAQSISGGIFRYVSDSWSLIKFISGHVNEVTSIDVCEDMILSSSLDFTSRIWSHELCEEIGRPQIHGHPIMCARFLKKMPLQIISGADETIVRILRSTKLFNANYARIMNEHLASKLCSLNQKLLNETDESNNDLIVPKMARLSELSLTTEVFSNNYESILKEGNNERNLSMNFLFAETNKLYGHFFEITDIAISDEFIISANKSTTQKFSGIFVWNYSFEKLDYIPIHILGIQRLRFSGNGQIIIACSRDTTVSLYKHIKGTFQHCITFKNHKRVVWDCDISFDSSLAASCSRDKNLIIYDLNTLSIKHTHLFNHEPTSLSFHKSQNILAVGFSNGFIEIFEFNDCLKLISSKRVHSSKVNCLCFFSDTMICSGGEDGMLVFNEFDNV